MNRSQFIKEINLMINLNYQLGEMLVKATKGFRFLS